MCYGFLSRKNWAPPAAVFVTVNCPPITTPTANQRWSNAVFTVRGTSGDNVGVTAVQYQLNGGTWNLATTTNNWSSWTAVVNLTPSTNTVAAYTVDAAGNHSSTITPKVIYVLSAPLITQARAALASKSAVALRGPKDSASLTVDSSEAFGAPLLQITLSGSLVNLSWPVTVTGYVVETCDIFSPTPSWATLTNSATIVGDDFVVTDELKARFKFYRLWVTEP